MSNTPGTDRAFDPIQQGFERILSDYAHSRSSEEFSGSHPLAFVFKEIKRALQNSDPIKNRVTLQVEWSFGTGNWARVPWIALMDTKETVTTQSGVYCVWLFRQDMTGVYLTLNQGVTKPRQQLGRAAAREYVRSRAAEIQSFSTGLSSAGFQLDDRIDLRASPGLGREYEESTIAYRFYPVSEIPNDETLLRDVEAVLGAYDVYLQRSSQKTTNAQLPKTWIFQANPTVFDLKRALAVLPVISWNATQYSEEMRPGDRVYLWVSGVNAGILAVGTLVTTATMRSMGGEEQQFLIESRRFESEHTRIDVKIDKVLGTPLLRREIKMIPGLKELSILHQAQSTNFRVAPAEAEILSQLIDQPIPALTTNVTPDMRRVLESFQAALSESNIKFGVRHLDVVRTFLTSLATKPFVILTGLSGSGKTQLAYRFGQWLGKDRVALIPVRPDWTGPEQLLGYEDALLPTENGRRGWHVPEALQFMLRAADDPGAPYLLVLDEMNLAHVERYFADVLSGMESGAPSLPNLKEHDGVWRQVEDVPERIRYPENLFLVGTVNVDETTYMFSPKVLDRANTLEFRVESLDFDLGARKATDCASGAENLVRGFLQIATDQNWQHEHPTENMEFFQREIMRVHSLLSEGDFEFGHRVFYEAVRFASILDGAGGTSPETR